MAQAAQQAETAADDKKQGSTQPRETELGEVRAQATPGTDNFRATEANTGALGDRPLLDTPFSINVVTDQPLKNQQAATPQDVFRNDPSMTWTNLPVLFSTLRGFPLGSDGYQYDGLPAFSGLSAGS